MFATCPRDSVYEEVGAHFGVVGDVLIEHALVQEIDIHRTLALMDSHSRMVAMNWTLGRATQNLNSLHFSMRS